MVEIFGLKPVAKKSADSNKKNILHVLIDVNVDNIPEDCQEINLACNVVGRWVWVQAFTLKNITGNTGMGKIYNALGSKTFEEHVQETVDFIEEQRSKYNSGPGMKGLSVGEVGKFFEIKAMGKGKKGAVSPNLACNRQRERGE
jgi:hypothetical protein